MNSAKTKKQSKPATKKVGKTAPVEKTPVEKTPVEKTTKSKKTKTPEAVPEPDVVEEAPAPKTRKTVDRDTVLEEFDNLVASVESEIESLRQNSKGGGNVKFLRSLNKNIKNLRTQTGRVMKKKKTERKNNTTSGFLKPVAISNEMAKFTGWDAKELRSRVEVTKYICDYIKEHDLQNPADRREIRPDNKLQKLLDVSNDSGALKYYSLQTHLKKHFPKA
jgi:chromatin remodeling complex protein RSC6